MPTAALLFFRPENLDRFKFTKKTVARDGTWEIAFRETERPTLIRTPGGASVPSAGSLWVSAADGTVVRTSLLMHDVRTRAAHARTPHRHGAGRRGLRRASPPLGLWLPETMTESYDIVARPGAGAHRRTEAKYSDYRVFQTSVRIK